jgi:hypothetical protein
MSGQESGAHYTSLCNRPSSYSCFFSAGAVAVAVTVAAPSTCFASLRMPESRGEEGRMEVQEKDDRGRGR